MSAGTLTISTLSVTGSSSCGLFSVVGITTLGSAPLFHSFARLDFASSVSDPTHPESTVFSQSPAQLGFILLVMRNCALGSPMSLLDFVTAGFATFLQSSVRMGLALFVLDLASFDLFVLFRSLAKMGFATPLFDFGHLGFLMPVPSSEQTISDSDFALILLKRNEWGWMGWLFLVAFVLHLFHSQLLVLFWLWLSQPCGFGFVWLVSLAVFFLIQLDQFDQLDSGFHLVTRRLPS